MDAASAALSRRPVASGLRLSPQRSMRKTIIVVLSSLLVVSCGGRGGTRGDQRDYDVVEEGSAAGVTSTIQGPGEVLPPITGTNADTTTAFTLNPDAIPPGSTGTAGTIAGTLPPPVSPGMTAPAPRTADSPAAPPPMTSSRPAPTPQQARPSPTAPRPRPVPAQPQPEPVNPAEPAPEPVPEEEPEQVDPPPTQTDTQEPPPPPG